MRRLASTLLLCLLPILALAQAVGRDAWMQADTRAQLKSGMTREKVEETLGKPTRLRTTRSDAGHTLDLEYRSADGRDWMVVNFMDGRRLSSYSVARLGTGEPAGSAQKWRTPSSWQQVRPGMSLEQVEAILGAPTARSYVGGMLPEALSAWVYDMNPGTDQAAGIIIVDATGRVITVMTPLFPPS